MIRLAGLRCSAFGQSTQHRQSARNKIESRMGDCKSHRSNDNNEEARADDRQAGFENAIPDEGEKSASVAEIVPWFLCIKHMLFASFVWCVDQMAFVPVAILNKCAFSFASIASRQQREFEFSLRWHLQFDGG